MTSSIFSSVRTDFVQNLLFKQVTSLVNLFQQFFHTIYVPFIFWITILVATYLYFIRRYWITFSSYENTISLLTIWFKWRGKLTQKRGDSANKHHIWKGFQKTLYCNIEAKLYQFEIRAMLVIFLPKFNAIT